MTKRFVEVVDPYEKHTNHKNPFSDVNSVSIGNEQYNDYTEEEWENMMEYYYAYEYTPKGR